MAALYAEMDALETDEARLYKALDKLEAVIQHNEAPISTWLPREYALNPVSYTHLQNTNEQNTQNANKNAKNTKNAKNCK